MSYPWSPQSARPSASPPSRVTLGGFGMSGRDVSGLIIGIVPACPPIGSGPIDKNIVGIAVRRCVVLRPEGIDGEGVEETAL